MPDTSTRRKFMKSGIAATAGIMTAQCAKPTSPPNLIFILTDDQRYDALGCAGNQLIHTPNMDRLAARGVLFRQACVTLSICTPSRAVCLTGRYGSANGVDGLGKPINAGERTVAQILADAGYATGYVGKWHLPGQTPTELGFQFDIHFKISNGPWWDRITIEQDVEIETEGFVADYIADKSIAFMKNAVSKREKFFLHIGTQLPHVTERRTWEPRPETLARYNPEDMPLPGSMHDDLSGKPEYLKTNRNQEMGKADGYHNADGIRQNTTEYWASTTDLDTAVGRIMDTVDQLGIADNTWIILMGDNGWFMGEHGFTSKKLAYEESMRVPMIVAGPGVKSFVDDNLVMNIDIMPTLLELAEVPIADNVHGTSMVPLICCGDLNWRRVQYYEAPRPGFGSWPFFALRTKKWKYIQTRDIDQPDQVVFEELYNIQTDADELHNLANNPDTQDELEFLREELVRQQAAVAG
jgi:arylsulfatase A-like enzyme